MILLPDSWLRNKLSDATSAMEFLKCVCFDRKLDIFKNQLIIKRWGYVFEIECIIWSNEYCI